MTCKVGYDQLSDRNAATIWPLERSSLLTQVYADSLLRRLRSGVTGIAAQRSSVAGGSPVLFTRMSIQEVVQIVLESRT
jgi:hypothetical protein